MTQKQVRRTEMETNAYLQGKATILHTFTVKGFKSWIPRVMREGVGAEATLYKDGKKIGLLIDEGHGGQVEFRPDGDAFREVIKFLVTLPLYEFKDYWKEEMEEEWDGDKELTSWNVHTFADVMLTHAEKQRS